MNLRGLAFDDPHGVDSTKLDTLIFDCTPAATVTNTNMIRRHEINVNDGLVALAIQESEHPTQRAHWYGAETNVVSS